MTTGQATRAIHLSVDHTADKKMWRVTAECADERTELILVGSEGIVRIPDQDDLAGEYGRLLVEEHRARCSACRAWESAR